MERISEDLLSLETEPLRDGVLIVRLAGEIDISSVHLLRNRFTSLVGEGHSAVILDATRVTFMDSTGLHALVEGKRILHENGMRIFLVPSRQVRRVLELVFPDPMFASRLDTVEGALAALDESRPASIED
ncbi:MAG TPA: STAS domain-containing protein [Acidimicrobiia bacterium]|nr:STAS domain-containing protein [Acidimicrobiia bacterium]